MKRILSLLFLLGTLALFLPLFASCKDSGAVTLYVYNWGEYISDGSEGSLDTNAAFEAWYEETYHQKVKVNYSTYSSNEDMYAKLSTGAASYDIVVPSDYMIARLIAEGLVRRLNFDNQINPSANTIRRLFSKGTSGLLPGSRYCGSTAGTAMTGRG